MSRTAALALALAALAPGCKSSLARCRPGTLFLTVTLKGAATAADELHVTITSGAGTLSADTPYAHGSTLELQFPAGRYPANQTVSLSLTALHGGSALARVDQSGVTLPASCAALSLTVGEVGDAGEVGDGGDGGDTGAPVEAGSLPNGARCSDGLECSSTFCVDGYCCNALCDGQCEACDVDSLPGQCVPVASGAPHGTRPPCAAVGTTCGGSCSTTARNACTYPGPSITCAQQSCTGSTKSVAAGCDQAGACSTQQTITCPMGCSGSDCLGACTSDAACAAANPATPYCSTGVCTPKKPNGHSCSADGECTSNACADGVCCNNSCTGQCQSCVEQGSVGTCVYRVGAPLTGDTPARSGCLGTDQKCIGSCNGTSASCVYPTSSTSCGTQSCASGVLTPIGACDSNGGCTQTMTPCPNGACNSTNSACGPCTSDTQCGSSRWCNNGTCQNKLADGVACSANNQCQSASGCTTFYQDSDGDTYGSPTVTTQACGTTPPSGYVANNQDCCDKDSRAYPGQAAWFTMTNGPTMCGGYDYNCANGEEVEYPSMGSCTQSGLCDSTETRLCSTAAGWWGVSSIPGCGSAAATWITACATVCCSTACEGGGACCGSNCTGSAKTTIQQLQGCH